MRINNKLILRIIYSLFLLIITIFYLSDSNFTTLKISLIFSFLASLYSTSKKNYMLIVFLLMYGAFFVIPLAFGEINQLKYDYLLQSMRLSNQELKTVYYISIIYLTFISIFNCYPRATEIKTNYFSKKPIFKTSKKFEVFIYFLFIYISIFYFNKILAIQTDGYAAYHLGTISIKKSITYVIFELIFVFGCYYGIYLRKKSFLIIFVIYNIFILATGMRMPFLINIILLFYVLKQEYLTQIKSKLVYYINYFILIFLLPPFFLISNRFRSNALSEITIYDAVNDSYNELFTILGITLNTLKGAVIMKEIDAINVSVFSRFTTTILSVINKVSSGEQLSMTEKLDYGAFGSVMTHHFNSTLYWEGLTIGSSFIAETYLAFGFFGVIVAAFFHVKISSLLCSINLRTNFFGLIFFFSFGYWFLNSVRNDFIGWIPLALAYVLVYNLLNKIILKTKI
jgi:hypothetical protein